MMGFIFWRQHENDATKESSVKNTFESAVFGDTCRTQSYRSAILNDGNLYWLEAVYAGQAKGWTIYTKTKRKSIKKPGEKVIHQKETLTGQNLLEVAQFLSDYEATALEENLIIADKQEIETLGHAHYIAFAEREAIIFDENNIPSYPVNGKILGTGVYTEETHRKLNKSFANIQAVKRGDFIVMIEKLPDTEFEAVQTEVSNIDTFLKAIQSQKEYYRYAETHDYTSNVTLHILLTMQQKQEDIWPKGIPRENASSMLALIRTEQSQALPSKHMHNALKLYLYFLCIHEAARVHHESSFNRTIKSNKKHQINFDTSTSLKQTALNMLKKWELLDNPKQTAFIHFQECLTAIQEGRPTMAMEKIDVIEKWLEELKVYQSKRLGLKKSTKKPPINPTYKTTSNIPILKAF